MYKGGIRVADTYQSLTGHNNTVNPNNKLAFGKLNVNNNSNRCNCQLDDVYIFEVAMDSDEIMNLMQWFNAYKLMINYKWKEQIHILWQNVILIGGSQVQTLIL